MHILFCVCVCKRQKETVFANKFIKGNVLSMYRVCIAIEGDWICKKIVMRWDVMVGDNEQWGFKRHFGSSSSSSVMTFEVSQNRDRAQS